MRTGIFGGTFDPVHLGHLIIAQEVLGSLNLGEIRFVPAGQPWMKKGRAISPAEHRVKMLQLSIADNPAFVLDLADLERPGVTYTVDTLRDMQNQFGSRTELFFIMGADALIGFPSWKDPAEVLKLATLVVVPRPGYAAVNVDELEVAVPGTREKLVFLPEPCLGISGVDIRRRVSEGKSIRYLVAPGVAEYIQANGLYVRSSNAQDLVLEPNP